LAVRPLVGKTGTIGKVFPDSDAIRNIGGANSMRAVVSERARDRLVQRFARA
jgi:hypothetical protein